MMPAPVALVTGATSGIGRALALRLARDGWKLLLHGRNEGRCQALMRELEASGAIPPHCYIADFQRLGDVSRMIDEIVAREERIDLLVNNAGTGFINRIGATDDGNDATIQVNYLAPFLLIANLQGLMRGTEGATILNVGSLAQYGLTEHSPFATAKRAGIAYGRSKLALAMATRELAAGLATAGISILCAHPGSMVPTQLSRHLLDRAPWPVRLLLQRAAARAPSDEEAADYLAAAVAPAFAIHHRGAFVANTAKVKLHRQMRDAALRQHLLRETEKALAPFLRRAEPSALDEVIYLGRQAKGRRHA